MFRVVKESHLRAEPNIGCSIVWRDELDVQDLVARPADWTTTTMTNGD
jgi:hypothetical protein